MKREILFRGKRIDNGEWVEGGFHEHQNRTLCAIGDSLKPEDIDHLILKSGFSDWNMPKPLNAYKVHPDTIGQFTGLTDKNGKRIFEGDIDNMGWIVCFEYGVFCIKERINAKTFIPFSEVFSTEVIGNIHDNPELI